MTGTTVYQIDERDLNAFVAEAARRAGVNTLEKYRQTMVSVSWVAELHSVSRATVINYINDGLIEPVVRVSGDSMNDGTSRSLSDGDEVLVRELAPSEWENLPIRNRLFIITSREGNVLKQIKEVNKEERYIVCHSFNTSFEDFTLNFDDIYQIFVIYKIVQKQIRLE